MRRSPLRRTSVRFRGVIASVCVQTVHARAGRRQKYRGAPYGNRPSHRTITLRGGIIHQALTCGMALPHEQFEATVPCI